MAEHQRQFVPLYDGLGSTRQLANSAGTVTDTYLYDSFGNIIPGGSSGTTTNPFQYVGRLGYYADIDTGIYYVRMRRYAPRMSAGSGRATLSH